jgi:drug/metabolite transporter (DMT)-like permease
MTTELQRRSESAPPSASRRTTLIWIALITVYVLWGSTYFGIRVAVETMPPLLMAGVRFLIAGTVLCAWRLPAAMRAHRMPTAAEWRRTLVIGLALLLGGNGAVAWAEQTVTSGATALIVAAVPLWMALIDRLAYGTPFGFARMAGLVVGFGGIVVLVGGASAQSIPIVGAAVLVAGSLSWAAGSVYSREARLPSDSLLTTGMEMLCGGFALCIAGAATGELARVHLAAISPASWLAFGYLVVFGGIAGFSAYLWVIRAAPTALVSTYAYVNPIVAVALGSVFLHEPLTPRTVLAGIVIVAGVAIIVSSRSLRNPQRD